MDYSYVAKQKTGRLYGSVNIFINFSCLGCIAFFADSLALFSISLGARLDVHTINQSP